MTAIEILENKHKNLIPVINPGLSGETGIRAAVLYRICPSIEIDTADVVKEAYKIFYGDDIPKDEIGDVRGDVIFNAFIPFLDFCRAKTIVMRYKTSYNQKKFLPFVFLHLEELFDSYDELRMLFDRYFDLMYSFSNLMPVPKYFNGSKGKIGKGTWKINNDYPSIYYKNLLDSNCKVHEKEYMKSWLDRVMDSYIIRDMYELEPPYPIKEYYGRNDDKLIQLTEFLKKAIALIENRFK